MCVGSQDPHVYLVRPGKIRAMQVCGKKTYLRGIVYFKPRDFACLQIHTYVGCLGAVGRSLGTGHSSCDAGPSLPWLLVDVVADLYPFQGGNVHAGLSSTQGEGKGAVGCAVVYSWAIMLASRLSLRKS